jgi:hypothetical protein
MTTAKRIFVLLGGMSILSTVSCVSLDDGSSEKEAPPEIYANMPLESALEAAIDHGGVTLEKVKKLINRQNSWEKAVSLLEPAISRGILKYNPHQLINASNIYNSSPQGVSAQLYRKLASSGRPLAKQLAWQMAASHPSQPMAEAINDILTEALEAGEMESVMTTQMATAVKNNNLTSAYTFVRQGLMSQGHEEFAKAMIALDPKRSSSDFLNYLALAPVEELRQLTLSSVDMYSCLIILRHFKANPPPVSHIYFKNIFYYSVSRNNALAELAKSILNEYLPQHADHLALTLSRLDTWIQTAFLESSRRNLSTKLGILLSELKKVTPNRAISEEIDGVTR